MDEFYRLVLESVRARKQARTRRGQIRRELLATARMYEDKAKGLQRIHFVERFRLSKD